MRTIRNYHRWDQEMEALNNSNRGMIRRRMGSEDSARATASRLRQLYRGVQISNRGRFVFMELER